MLLSVTLNPSVDISYHLNQLKLDDVNRVSEVKKTAGGKGLNVARVAHLLGVDVLATGILGGSLGRFIENQLDEDQMKHAFLHTNQEARNCIAILHENMQTEILESGPTLSTNEQESFLQHFNNILENVNVVTISGSIVKGFTKDVYSEIIAIAKERNIPVILDTSGKALEISLKNKSALPYVIKPNTTELSQLLGHQVTNNNEQLKSILKDPLFEGVPWIIVSQGGDGAFVKHEDKFYDVSIPTVEVVNSVGSGDATVAGLAKAIEQKLDDITTIKYGMAAGILNTIEAQTGFVDATKFDYFVNLVNVKRV
ncbi:hexose kinase [Caldibacillus thermoamylovorans]|uniref:hexose kinase n=1 Tax=Caldibacillus thermoamylovorans TaxID=35841 RepID=UPI001D089813|nr:hexose kinase [Caldibacillus thermoamylovorans]MCB5936671.1 hexose kinase [Bacillus sp. DFI.2.34]MCB7078211.1 hexose kinase [Caldibacillus thermoamylovorans]